MNTQVFSNLDFNPANRVLNNYEDIPPPQKKKNNEPSAKPEIISANAIFKRTFGPLSDAQQVPDRQPSLLRQIMVLDAAQDQKDLLSSASDKELKEIFGCFDHPLMREIVPLIKSGQWNNLIQFMQTHPELPIYAILKAAFCQGLIGEKYPSTEGIDNLASAYIFLGPLKAGQEFRICHFEEIQKEAPLWDDISSRWQMDQIPENQHYFILVEKTSMTWQARKLMRALFNRKSRQSYVAGSIAYYQPKVRVKKGSNAQGWALGSAGLIRTDQLLKGHPPIYGRGLRPVNARFDHLLQGGFEVALYEPTDVRPKEIHGMPPQGNLLTIHDCYHGIEAVRNEVFSLRELMLIGKQIQELLNRKIIPPYSKNARIVTRNFYKVLEKQKEEMFSEDDWVRFLLSETLIFIQDGEKIKAGYDQKPPFEILTKVMNSIMREMLAQLKMTDQHIEQFLPRLNEYFQSFGYQFFVEEYHLYSRLEKAE